MASQKLCRLCLTFEESALIIKTNIFYIVRILKEALVNKLIFLSRLYKQFVGIKLLIIFLTEAVGISHSLVTVTVLLV